MFKILGIFFNGFCCVAVIVKVVLICHWDAFFVMIPTLVSAYSEVTLGTTEIFGYTHIWMHLFYVEQVMCRCSECKFYVLTGLLQDVTLCHLACSSLHFQGHDAFIFRDLSSLRRLWPPEVETATILWNVRSSPMSLCHIIEDLNVYVILSLQF